MNHLTEKGAILESWKEIAAHLHRNVRTCQLWERDLGLPVHRLDGSPKARVFAYAAEIDRWLAEKLRQHDGADRPGAPRRGEQLPTLPRWNIAVMAGLLAMIVALAVFIWLIPRRDGYVPSVKNKPSIAFLGFENLSEDPDLDLWREGLPRLLMIELSQSRLLDVLDPSSLDRVLKKLGLDRASAFTREDLARLADECRVTHVATGTLKKPRSGLALTLALFGPHTGQAMAPIDLACSGEGDLASKAGELASRIKAAMGFSPSQLAEDSGRGIQEVTTRSPEALRYYLQAYNNFRSMDYPKTRGLLERAIECDPDFAMAYVALAASYEGERDYGKGRELRKKAFDLRDRLPEGEGDMIEANYYMTLPGEDSRQKAIEAYERYFGHSSRNAGEMQSLGMCYENNGEYGKALEWHLRAYREDPSPQYLLGVLFGLQHLGQMDLAAEMLRDYQETSPGSAMLQWCATYLAINRGEYDQALAEIERGFLLDPTPSWSWECHRGDVYMVRGDLAGAERTYLQVIEKAAHPDYVLLAKYRLLALYILQGRVMRASAGDLDPCLEWQGPNGSLWGILNACLRSRRADRAAEYIDRALASSRKLGDPLGYRRWLEWKGVAAIDRHDLGGAETVAAELEISVNASPYAIERRKIEHIRGLIALEKGRYEAAINDLESACARLPAEVLSRWMEFQSWHRYPLALAYFGAGRMGRARAEFERLTRLVGSKLWYGDLYAKSFYWLGKIAEAQKDRKKALENYGKFLEIWKDADAGQPELEDARARLAALGIGAAGGDR